MDHDTERLLVGVIHNKYYLKEVIEFLRKEGIKNKGVMLEIAKNRVPSQPPTDGLTFFEELRDFVLAENGLLIYGDDEEILERAYAKNKELYRKMKRPGLSIMQWVELHSENRYHVPFVERDPHFLKVIQEQNPDIVVLGKAHLPYLIEHHFANIPHRDTYIPKE